MTFYVVLIAATVVIALLAGLSFARNQNVGILLGTFFLYYFSIYGAWFVVYNALGGNVNSRYFYLFNRLVAVRLDGEYLQSILYYTLFVVIVQLCVLATPQARSSPVVSKLVGRPSGSLIQLDAKIFALLSLANLALSYRIIGSSIQAAIHYNVSLYQVTRGISQVIDLPRLFTVHQIASRIAFVLPVLALAVLLSGARPRFLALRGNRWSFALVAAAALVSGGYLFLLGNKNELLFAVVAGFLLYLSNAEKVRSMLVVGSGLAVLGAISAVDAFRGINPASLGEQAQSSEFLTTSLFSFLESTEAFAAHFSLYAIFVNDVPLIGGASFVSLFFSIIPRVIWPGRPASSYEYYSEAIHAAPGQGYTLHHAAGWYLNFGVLGILLGALVLGMLWRFLLVAQQQRYSAHAVLRLFWILAPCYLAAGFPMLMRTGVEGYKGLVIDSFIMPTLFAALAIRRGANRTVADHTLPGHTPNRYLSRPIASNQ